MKKIKLLIKRFTLITLSTLALLSINSCNLGPVYGYFDIYIDKALFGNLVEFSHNGELLTESYLGYDELYSFTADATEAKVQIDYNFEFNGELFSSTNGTGEPVILTAPEDGEIISQTYTYELRPTGLVDNPFLIFHLDEEDDSGGGDTPCDLAYYKGPEFNTQIDAQCKTAFLYDCVGNADGVAAACALYYQYDDGSPDFPDCPYCK